MRNIILLLITTITIAGCTKQDSSGLQAEIDKLKTKIDELKPGLGEIMGVIQLHHAKLYYSGVNQNWDLANYQLDEIKEGINQGIELYEHFKDVKVSLKDLSHVTDKSLAELEDSIKKKNKIQFLKGFNNLTQACNQCHRSADKGFIVIQIPKSSMFSNQEFVKNKN